MTYFDVWYFRTSYQFYPKYTKYLTKYMLRLTSNNMKHIDKHWLIWIERIDTFMESFNANKFVDI